jgi:hypothetical protein
MAPLLNGEPKTTDAKDHYLDVEYLKPSKDAGGKVVNQRRVYVTFYVDLNAESRQAILEAEMQFYKTIFGGDTDIIGFTIHPDTQTDYDGDTMIYVHKLDEIMLFKDFKPLLTTRPSLETN